MVNHPVNLNDPTGHTAVIPLFYIGIVFFAAVALAITAYAYSNDPNFRDVADQTVAMAITGKVFYEI